MHKDFNSDKYFRKADLTENEILWLTKFMKLSFKERIKENDVTFSKTRTQEKITITLPQISIDYLNGQIIPKRFLKKSSIMKITSDDNKNEAYILNVEMLYWFLDIIDDFLSYKDTLDSIYIEAFGGTNKKYDDKNKGFKIMLKHLEKICKSWKPIEKTILLGFANYLGLFQKGTFPSLGKVLEGIKNNTIKSFGLTQANKEAFGRMFHREQLHLCWNCGDSVKTKGALCKDCAEYWDEKTK
ncbi:MAG: hypothetical protein ACTSPK_09325 [Candidatus Heimdallarchaeota archaeon]